MSKTALLVKKKVQKYKTTSSNDMYMSFEIFLIIMFVVEKKDFEYILLYKMREHGTFSTDF